MRRVSLKEATADFASLAKAVSEGEEVEITQENGPTIQLVTDVSALRARNRFPGGQRPLGMFKDEIRIGPEFDDPLPDDIMKAFTGEGP